MLVLYHFPLQPFSRKLRLYLAEKGFDFQLRIERFWEQRREFLELSPGGEVPLLVEENGDILADTGAICEYFEELYRAPDMLGLVPEARLETRRLIGWFDQKFYREVSGPILEEKVLKRLRGQGGPDTRTIRAAHANIGPHLEYIGWLCDRRLWLAGTQFSLADITAAAHLSAIDFLGEVPWDQYGLAKDWYARVKSRPSFRPLLADAVPGAMPARHYADLDF